MTFPYEHNPWFIEANADIQSRFLQAFPGNRPDQIEKGRPEACCRKLREKVELHRAHLRFQLLTELERGECLREKIFEEHEMLSRHPGQNYPALLDLRDLLVRELVDREMDAKPVESKGARVARKGDISLLQNQHAVNFKKAEEYLGITSRGRQKAVNNGKLVVIGEGRNRKITAESLLRFLPPST